MRQDLQYLAETYFADLTRAVKQGPPAELAKIVDVLFDAFLHGNEVYTLGNGASAALAAHMACDLEKGIGEELRAVPPGGGPASLKTTSLASNVALLSAYGNDVAYESVFAEQLRCRLTEDDVVIAVSGSGRSPNVLRAVEYARAVGATTIGFTGSGPGAEALATRCDITVRAPVVRLDQTEDLHVTFMHVVAMTLRQLARAHVLATVGGGQD